MKYTLLFLACFLVCGAVSGRVRTVPSSGGNHSSNGAFYSSFAVGYIPLPHNSGSLSANLSVGYLHGNWFAEYEQIIGLSSSIYVPKIFAIRSGYSFALDECLSLRPFIGGGVMPVTTLEAKHKAIPVYCTGLALIQSIGSDLKIKYELSLNNKYIIPSIGLIAEF